MEAGEAIDNPDFKPLPVNVGKPELTHGEGPAVFSDSDAGAFYLLINEFAPRGYQLFTTRDLASAEWTHIPSAQLPPGARHGSVIPISAHEHSTLLEFA